MALHVFVNVELGGQPGLFVDPEREFRLVDSERAVFKALGSKFEGDRTQTFHDVDNVLGGERGKNLRQLLLFPFFVIGGVDYCLKRRKI